MSLRLGLTEWTLPVHGASALHVARSVGVDCIQIEFWHPGSAHCVSLSSVQDDYVQAVEQSQVSIIGMGAKATNDLCMIAPSTERHADCAQVMHAALREAHALSVPLVFFPSFRTSLMRSTEDMLCTARLLKLACRAAADLNLKVASENSLGAQDNLRLLDAVDASNFGILVDTYNARFWGNPLHTLFDYLGAHIVDQLHVKDGLGGSTAGVSLGQGDGCFEETTAVLRARNYAGAVLLEGDFREGADRLRTELDLLRSRLAGAPVHLNMELEHAEFDHRGPGRWDHF